MSGRLKPASGSHVCRPCRHLPASPGASLVPTPSSFSKPPHLFHREKLKKRKDQVSIQKVRDASSQVVLRHLAGGKESLFAKTLLTAQRGGQAAHCACALVVPPGRADDNGRACALWALPTTPASLSHPPPLSLSTPSGWGSSLEQNFSCFQVLSLSRKPSCTNKVMLV